MVMRSSPVARARYLTPLTSRVIGVPADVEFVYIGRRPQTPCCSKKKLHGRVDVALDGGFSCIYYVSKIS